jgi:hypothetical protein
MPDFWCGFTRMGGPLPRGLRTAGDAASQIARSWKVLSQPGADMSKHIRVRYLFYQKIVALTRVRPGANLKNRAFLRNLMVSMCGRLCRENSDWSRAFRRIPAGARKFDARSV